MMKIPQCSEKEIIVVLSFTEKRMIGVEWVVCGVVLSR